MKKLMKEANAHSVAKVKDKSQLMQGKTIVKSISTAKRVLSKKKAPAKPKAKSRSKSKK